MLRDSCTKHETLQVIGNYKLQLQLDEYLERLNITYRIGGSVKFAIMSYLQPIGRYI